MCNSTSEKHILWHLDLCTCEYAFRFKVYFCLCLTFIREHFLVWTVALLCPLNHRRNNWTQNHPGSFILIYISLYKKTKNQIQCLHWKYILTMKAWCHISNSHSYKKHWSYSKGRVTLQLTYSNSYPFLLNFSLAISKTGTLIKRRGIWLTSAQIGVFFFYYWGEQ